MLIKYIKLTPYKVKKFLLALIEVPINTVNKPEISTDFLKRLTILSRKLGYEFKDPILPHQALTHRSFDSKRNYERLEFLGDALLGMIVGEALYHRYPLEDEGRLTRMRATLVRQECLVKIAQSLALGDYLILGIGERKGGGRHRASILADTVESLIGAIYLDSQSIETARRCTLAWYGDLLDNINNQKVLKDAKSRLQEWLQAKQIELPVYELIETQGNAPNQVFVVKCHVDIPQCADIIQSGESRRIAEQKAAELMMVELNKLPVFANKLR